MKNKGSKVVRNPISKGSLPGGPVKGGSKNNGLSMPMTTGAAVPKVRNRMPKVK